MRPLLIAAAALAMAVPAELVAAEGSNVSAAFGNTILSTYPDGRTAKLWLKADGTYTAVGRRRTPSSGTWKVKGEKICLSQKKPTRGPISYCTEIRSGGVGTSWSGRAVTGEKIKITLVAGKQ